MTDSKQGPRREAFACPACRSGYSYFRRRSQSFVCRKCGASWPAPWVDRSKGKKRKAIK